MLSKKDLSEIFLSFPKLESIFKEEGRLFFIQFNYLIITFRTEKIAGASKKER